MLRRRVNASVVLLVLTQHGFSPLPELAYAQEGEQHHESHSAPGEAQQHPPRPGAPESDEHAAEPLRHDATADHARMMKAMVGPLGLSMRQFASGTSWQPATSPMYGHMWLVDDWTLMLHYNVFAGLDVQGTPKGKTAFATANWAMGMAQRTLLGGQLTVRAMFSLEPLAGRRGYPLLLQTGETAYGEPLVDRQHPHDLFMELAMRYNHALGDTLAFELYVAPSGEPALGAPAFPHRISAYADPFAPLGHHWQDSSHISFGVVTVGLYSRQVKLEASWFNGVEPDEQRYGIDLKVPDSYSTRLTVNPTPNWSMQASYGFLAAPEAREPEQSLHRLSASAIYNRRLPGGDNWATTFVWGQNLPSGHAGTNALLAETNFRTGHNVLFSRGEFVQKTAHDFALDGVDEHEVLPVGMLAVGYVREFGPYAKVIPGLGGRIAVNAVDETLGQLYGSRFPVGGIVFVRVRPADMMFMGP